ncbi:MAG: cation transporter [Clostridia bacterium]|nr:cation transporter [Clostridia bacterium]
MTDLIIALIAVVAVGFGIRATVRHFQHKSACCGGEDYKPRKKKLAHVVSKKVISISGMSCERCQNRVMEALNDIAGVSAVVSFKKGTAVVSMETSVEDAVLKSAVEKAGYMATGIE